MSSKNLGEVNNTMHIADDKPSDPLERIRTAGSVSIPPELFEQLYLAPFGRVKGELRQTFGNPTPIGQASDKPLSVVYANVS